MSLKEVFALIKKQEENYRQETERLRFIAYTFSAPYLPKHTTIKKFWLLPWEKSEPVKVMKKPEFDKIVTDLKILKVI